MNFEELAQKSQELADEAISEAIATTAERCGLDRRATYTLWRGDDFLAVRVCEDRSLRYYGGFEYIDNEHRQELGGYVFYSTDDARVLGHWEQGDPCNA